MTTAALLPDRRPAVVLLHSSMSSRSQWAALMSEHERSYRFLALDLLGYGKAPFPDHAMRANFSLAHEVEAVQAALATHLAPDEPFHLVGHSYGGATALRLARTLPARILSLAVFEPVAFHLLDESDAERAEIGAVIAAIETAVTPEDATRRFIDYWNGPGAFDALTAPVRARFAAQVAKVRLDFTALLGEPATLADMAAIAVPALLLSGRAGPASTRAVVTRLAAALPHATTAQTPGGHMAPVTHAADVNRELAAFLARVS
ncbi:alpha/beta fold hydrolase [Pseudoduganella umbonata]|uniref:Alpha/beta hydrolase n=1 Tax=Pseudoduganella umbonata TaxID=864828 RepID=A0A4P8HXN2_9BURK|nr:alpha/beta hydrolase [Pseudoduganella umbonata]MBB3223415.1 pimeloyl-ACP methyl ester carboxylesterase [Pseudoduganella umbonata]QCP13688.1 alpha/beta hydrolase [Pseudoduganella umbonata]